MQSAHRTIDARECDRDYVSIVTLGDVHWGTRSCCEHAVRERVQKIAIDPWAWWLDLGDEIDAINYKDKRFDPLSLPDRYDLRHLANLFLIQLEEYCDLVRPIRDKNMGGFNSNHMDTLKRFYTLDIHWELRRRMTRDLPNGMESEQFADLGDTAFIYLTILRRNQEPLKLTLWGAHGTGRGNSEEAAIRRLKTLSKPFAADIKMMGHVHWAAKGEEVSLISPTEDRKILYVVTGSFLKSYGEGPGSYAEQRLYPPIPLSAMEIRIYLDTGDYDAFKF